MKTNLKFWIPLALLLAGCGVLGWLLYQQSSDAKTLATQKQQLQTRADSLLTLTNQQKQTINSNEEDKTHQAKQIEYRERIKYIETDRKATELRISNATPDEKARIFASFLDDTTTAVSSTTVSR